MIGARKKGRNGKRNTPRRDRPGKQGDSVQRRKKSRRSRANWEDSLKAGTETMATLAQGKLFRWSEVHVASDIERLRLVLSALPDEALMQRLERRRGKGRDDYPVRPIRSRSHLPVRQAARAEQPLDELRQHRHDAHLYPSYRRDQPRVARFRAPSTSTSTSTNRHHRARPAPPELQRHGSLGGSALSSERRAGLASVVARA